jgi:hypothetical protein
MSSPGNKDEIEFNVKGVAIKVHRNTVYYLLGKVLEIAIDQIKSYWNNDKPENENKPEQKEIRPDVKENDDIDPLPDEKKEGYAKPICPICMDKEANAVLVPCGHTICFDGNCKNNIQQCPICRAQFTNIIKYYSQV